MMKRNKPFTSRFILLFLIFLCLNGVSLANAQTDDELADKIAGIELLYRSGKVDKADALLKEFQQEYPQSSSLPKLLLLSGRAKDTAMEAVPVFRQIVDEFPGSPQAPLAQIELAQIFFISGNSPTAMAEAKRFLEKFPNHPKAAHAKWIQAGIDAQSGRIRMAANRYAEIPLLYPKSSRVAHAWVGLGDCKFRIGDLPQAERAYMKALETKAQDIDLGKVYYQLGLIAQKRNRPGEARRFYLLLTRNHQNSRYAPQAQKNLQAMEKKSASGGILPSMNLQLNPIPNVRFAVSVGTCDSIEKCNALAEPFKKAGHEAGIHAKKEGNFEVLIGSFMSETEVFAFAEELGKKFGVKTEIRKLEP